MSWLIRWFSNRRAARQAHTARCEGVCYALARDFKRRIAIYNVLHHCLKLWNLDLGKCPVIEPFQV